MLAAQEATRLDPARPAAFARLGELRGLRGDRAGAQAAYAQAARLAPGDAAIRTALGAARLALELNAQARRDAAQALTLKPDAATRARALYVGGVAAYRLGDLAAARTALRQSTQAAPGADAYLWLGLTAYAQKDYAGAAGALTTSVKLDPTPTARQNLGSALLATSRYAEAEAILRGLTGEQPRNAEAWYLLGLSLRSQGREAQARPALKTAADLGHRRAAEALR
ncbi:tetratricopeptide repeat protein [Deinococcus sp. MIMF12]|uniref:Tetratricopeptide repeat protein n=1 Tax=Deinococcus rhizophilus TaxID=3049544 RepID=A0ABT7JFR7_9DEIO|nr:tetratricopeptide repeat protein [Deinococcus rhizophilus]MDL2343903.1 tetratricopeptide repeat protein [Deinococcus rhizophilus]